MFEDIEKIEGSEEQQQKPNHNSWKYMNPIQKTGVVGSVLLYLIALPVSDRHAGTATIIGVCGWSFMLFGYVAGSLWKVRHALHFWYSMSIACIVHACLVPIYVFVVKGTFGSSGRGYIYLAGLLVSAETILLVIVLKRIAMRLHGRHPKSPKGLLQDSTLANN